MGLMIVICTLTRLSHLKRKKNRNEVFFFLNYSCVPRVNIPCKAVLYNTCSVYGTICVPVHHVPAAVSFCRTRVTRNLGKVGAGGGV